MTHKIIIPFGAGQKKVIPYSKNFSDGNMGKLRGATWSVVGGKAVNTPTIGANLVADGGFENWLSATNLTSWEEILAGTSTVNQENTEKHGGNYAVRLDIDASNSVAQIYQTLTAPAGSWLYAEYYRKSSNGTATGGISSGTGNFNDWFYPITATMTKRVNTGFVTTANPQIYIKNGVATSASIYYDDLTANIIVPTSLFAYLPKSKALAKVSASWIIDTGSLAGVIMCIDSTSNPQNYVVLAHNGIDKIYLIKCVGGTLSQVAVATAYYSAGAPVELRHTVASTWQIWYNGSQAGADQTISDAGIVNNTQHGIFSASGGSQLNSFFVLPVL